MHGNDDSNIGRRPHLTKVQRMPQCYKETEKIIKAVKSCQINFKTVLAKSRLRGANFKKVYKLSLNVLKYYNYIEKIIDKLQLLKKEKFLRKEIAAVLIYELLFGTGILPGENKVVTSVQAYQYDIMTVHQELQNCNEGFGELNEIYVPRYARVHTLVTTVACVIKDLQNYGFNQIFYDGDLSEERFYQLLKSLERGVFLIDFHFKDMLVFSQAENLVDLDLYKNGHIFLQDKASYIPVHALNPEPGTTVLDACAAPGMKSAHIASKMKNKGILIACERDEYRFESLKEMMKYGSVKISRTVCTDFKLIDPNDEVYSTVDYILLDPSCSGSGMVNRMDDVTDTENSKAKERLLKLAGFQIILLKHALKFPSVKRVVYSTCSVHEEENEYVVQEALNVFGSSFKLVSVLSDCFDRGLESYEIGKMCLRTVPEKHLTNGFFVAMFERIEAHEHRRKKFSGKCSKNESIEKSDDLYLETADLDSKNLKMKSYVAQQSMDSVDPFENFEINNDEMSSDVKLKHKKRKKVADNSSYTEQQCSNLDVLEQSAEDYKSLNHDAIIIHDSFSQESTQQKTSELPKFKKKDKESKNKSKHNKKNEMENPKATFSESLQNSVKSICLPYTGNEAVDNKTNYKEQLSKNDSEVMGNYEEFDDSTLKQKKKKKKSKKKNSFEENINIYAQETGHMNETESFQNEPDKIKESSEFKLTCTESNYFENTCLKEDKNPSNTPVKEYKKHKKHSRDSDFTPSQLDSELVSDFIKSPSYLSNYSTVRSSGDSIHVSQNDLTELDNYSRCKKSKKHKKHVSTSNGSDYTVVSPDRNTNCVSSDITNEETNQTVSLHTEDISINSSDQHHHVKKKRKKHNKEYDSLNLQFSNTKELQSNQDSKKKLVQNDMQLIVTPTENDCIERKKRKKSKKYLADDTCFMENTTEGKNVTEDASIIGFNPMDSFHSEVRSKNCKKINTENELNNVPMPKEPENILFNITKKKKKKEKKEKGDKLIL